MKYTFLLCTLNRKDLMMEAVKSLLAQTYTDFEILVIDQSTEQIPEMENMDLRIVYYHSDKLGLSYNRNVGISLAKGEFICLMDDDATYTPQTLENIECSLRETGADILCGKMLDSKTGKISLHGMKERKIGITSNNIMEYCSSPSLVIRKKYAQEKFDEQFGVGTHWGCGEEVDLVLRCIYKGAKVIFDPQVVVYHPAVIKEQLKIEKAIAYSLGYGAVCAKHYYIYKNKCMKKYYYIALLKHWAALLIYFITGNKRMVQMYRKNIRNKIRGYTEYRKQRGD